MVRLDKDIAAEVKLVARDQKWVLDVTLQNEAIKVTIATITQMTYWLS